MFEFENIIGNENLIKALTSSFENNRLAHNYIFSGDEGSGKKLIAVSFVKLILCEKPKNNKPCCKCESCLSIETGNNPDVIFVKSDKKSIGVDIVREKILKEVYIKPFKFKYKIFIIQNAEIITIQAQNSLLKVIEEPPSYVKFLFLTKNYNYFLPTILSRTLTFNTLPLSVDEICKFLEKKHNVPYELAKTSAVYSQGSIGKATNFTLIKDFYVIRNEVIIEIKNLLDKDLINLYKFISKIEKYKENIQYILDIFFFTYRDMLIFKNTKDINLIFQKDYENLILEMSYEISNKRLIKGLEQILITKDNLNKNSNFNMTLEYLFFKLKEK